MTLFFTRTTIDPLSLMKRSLMLLLPTLSVATFILFFSVLQASAVEYEITPSPVPTTNTINTQGIDPTSPFWTIKAGMQKLLLVLSPSNLTQAEKALDYSNERLVFAQNLFATGHINEGIETLDKAEKYLALAADEVEQARLAGEDTSQFLGILKQSSLFHKSTIDYISIISPEQARAMVVKLGDYSAMLSKQIVLN